MPGPHHILSAPDIESLERATLDAVAPPAVEALHGWLLPFDHSTIGRAKSAVPLQHSSPLHTPDATVAMLQAIEARYALRGMRAAFRIPDVPGMANVQQELARLGYDCQQPTLVQVGSVLAMRSICTDPPATVSPTATPDWRAVYLADGFDPVDGAHRVQALSRSACALYASVVHAGHASAAGTASFSQGWASIHGMRTAPHARRQGLAARVLAGLAEAAIARGLERVFLQVEESNTSAQALYHGAGFSTAWRYHYWRMP